MFEARQIVSLIVLSLAVLLYWDATKHKIGKIKGEKGFLNIHAGAWGAAATFTFLLIAPITWGLYLYNRKKLIAKAKEQPVSLSLRHRIFIMALLFFLPILIGSITTPHSY